MIGEGLKTGELEACFRKLGVLGGGGGGKMVNGGLITEWKDLPMELLLRIVLLADDRTAIVASGVCTGWRDAMCLGLTRLSLSWCKTNMNNLLLSLAPKFTKLRVLSLRQAKAQLEDEAVEAVADFCHDLLDLDLSKSNLLTDRSLYALAHGCPNLTKLNISGCSSFSDAALAYLFGFCRNLKALNLCGCGMAATDRALEAIAYNCNQLETLNLGWCDFVTDIGVTSLAFGCPKLRQMDLCGCVLITDESVVALATRCLHLRNLGLYMCKNITDKAMYSLANSRVKSNRDLWEAVKKSRCQDGLENLNISQCTALTPSAVQAVCDSFPDLHTCPQKNSLIISGCLHLTSVHCACTFQHRAVNRVPSTAH